MQLMNNIESNIKKHAELVGAGVSILTWQGGQQLIDIINAIASGNIHAPDIGFLISSYFSGVSGQNVALAIGSYLGGEFLNQPALKKAAKGIIEANTIQHVLWWSCHSTPEKWAAMNANISNSTRENLANSPTTNNLNPYQY